VLLDALGELGHIHLAYRDNDVRPYGMKAVTAFNQFLDRLVYSPFLVDDAIHRDHQASAIGSMLTVDEIGSGMLGEQPHHLDDILILDVPGVDREFLIEESGLLRGLAVIVEVT
jgi:hypothetical protein